MLTEARVRELMQRLRQTVAPRLAEGHGVASGVFVTAARDLETALLAHATPPAIQFGDASTARTTSSIQDTSPTREGSANSLQDESPADAGEEE